MRGVQVKLAKQLAEATLVREGINPEKIPYRKYDHKVRKIVEHVRTILGPDGKEHEVVDREQRIQRTLNQACLRKQYKIAKRRLQRLLRTGFRDTLLIRNHLSSLPGSTSL